MGTVKVPGAGTGAVSDFWSEGMRGQNGYQKSEGQSIMAPLRGAVTFHQIQQTEGELTGRESG